MERTGYEEQRRLNNGIFLFKENQIQGITDSESLNSSSFSDRRHDKELEQLQPVAIGGGKYVKHTILSDFYDSEDDSGDEDYNPLLSTDTEDNEDTLEDAKNAQAPMVDRETTPDFIYEYDTDDYEDFDNTQYDFEPIKQRREFYKLSLNSLPYIILAFFTLLLSYNTIKLVSVGTVPSYDSGRSNDTMVNHKLMILNDQVNQLMQMKNEIADLRSQIGSLNQYQNQDKMNNSRSTITMTKDSGGHQIQGILSKLKDLESKIDRNTQTETIQLPERVQNVKQPPLSNIQSNNNNKSKQNIKTGKSTNPFAKYFNIANQGEVDVSLTTLPIQHFQKVRKTLVSKIIHGYADLVRRVKHKMFSTSSNANWWQVVTGRLSQPAYNLNVTNSPLNVLKEDEKLQWVNKVDDLPVYLTLKFNKGVKIKEIGFHQNLYSYSMKANIKNLSLFAQPTENIQALKKIVKTEVNQDINFLKFGKELKKWVRLGEMEYNIHLEQCYQSFPFNYKLIEDWPIERIMIIVHSNWGDPDKVIFDTLRVYEDTSTGLRLISSQEKAPEDDSVPFL